jgi:hypothetical protein
MWYGNPEEIFAKKAPPRRNLEGIKKAQGFEGLFGEKILAKKNFWVVFVRLGCNTSLLAFARKVCRVFPLRNTDTQVQHARESPNQAGPKTPAQMPPGRN